MTLGELQHLMDATYGTRDRERGVPATVAWLAEEVGELAQAVRKGTPAQQRHEFADVLAWVATLANQMGIDLDEARRELRRWLPQVPRHPLHLLTVTAGPSARRRTTGPARRRGPSISVMRERRQLSVPATSTRTSVGAEEKMQICLLVPTPAATELAMVWPALVVDVRDLGTAWPHG